MARKFTPDPTLKVGDTVFITTWWLGPRGVLTGRLLEYKRGTTRVKVNKSGVWQTYYAQHHVHGTREKADAHIKELAKARITKLRKEIKALQLMTEKKPMTLPAFDSITSKDQAQALAVDWQQRQSERSLTYGEIADLQDLFAALGKKFGLTAEFKENGII